MAEPKTATILDIEFPVTQPYDAGHVLTEAEAKALNQVRKENLVNQFRSKVKAHRDGAEGALDADQLQAEFAKIDSAYVFTVANVSATAKYTPVEKEARSLAKEWIKGQLAATNRKLSDIDEDKLEAKIAEVAAMPDIVKLAEKNIRERDKLAKLELGELGLSSEAATADAEAA